MVVAPIAGRLTDRIGAKLPIAAGLTLVAIALYVQTRITLDTTYADLLPAFILMGIGIGLTMSPMSTAAMNSVAEAKAGVASGILSMSRMVGGTFGVAAVGALFQHLTDDRLERELGSLPLSPQQQAWFQDNVGSADVQERLQQLDPATADQVGAALRDSFVHALSASMKLSTAVAVAGVVVALALVEHKRQPARAAAAAATAKL
jgi:MFS family permease